MSEVRRLPVVQLKGINYFVDARLGEARNVDNPHDAIGLVSMTEDEWHDLLHQLAKNYGVEEVVLVEQSLLSYTANRIRMETRNG